MEENVRCSHNVMMDDRKKLMLTGIKDVLSFDEETIVMESSMGRVTVKGAGLRVAGFDNKSGELSAEGKIFAIVYTSEERNGGFLSRIFR